MIQLDIFSDPICPWCYIGKAELDAALADRTDPPFTVRWLPFMLNPEMPAGGMDRRAYLEGKFGGRDGAVAAYRPIVERAEALGLPMNLDAIERTPATLDAQRLIHWARIEGAQDKVVPALFQAYFVDGRDIGDAEVLGDIADGAGMDASVVMRLLSSDADRAEIAQQDSTAREMGVNAVPTFIVAGQHAVPGAQPAALWSQVIAELGGAAET